MGQATARVFEKAAKKVNPRLSRNPLDVHEQCRLQALLHIPLQNAAIGGDADEDLRLVVAATPAQHADKAQLPDAEGMFAGRVAHASVHERLLLFRFDVIDGQHARGHPYG